MAKSWRSAAARRLRALSDNAHTTEDAVKTIAGRLLADVTTPPTDLPAVGAKLDVVSIDADKSLAGSGGLQRYRAGYRILYSPSQPVPRQRFTIAHELAHAVFERTGQRCPRHGRELERLCDMIATELLLPEAIFRRHVGDKTEIPNLRRVAKLFEASLSATLIRAAELFDLSVCECQDGTVTWSFGRDVRWMQKHVPKEWESVLKVVADTPSGRATMRLPSRKATRMFVVEWTRTSDVERQMILLHPLLNDSDKAVP